MSLHPFVVSSVYFDQVQALVDLFDLSHLGRTETVGTAYAVTPLLDRFFSGPGSRVGRTGHPLLVRIPVTRSVVQCSGSDRDS